MATVPGDDGFYARVNRFLANSHNPVARELVRNLVDLVERAVRNARPRKPGKHVRFGAVSATFGVGSTSAAELCRSFKLDPDEEIDGPTCETCAETAAEDAG